MSSLHLHLIYSFQKHNCISTVSCLICHWCVCLSGCLSVCNVCTCLLFSLSVCQSVLYVLMSFCYCLLLYGKHACLFLCSHDLWSYYGMGMYAMSLFSVCTNYIMFRPITVCFWAVCPIYCQAIHNCTVLLLKANISLFVWFLVLNLATPYAGITTVAILHSYCDSLMFTSPGLPLVQSDVHYIAQCSDTPKSCCIIKSFSVFFMFTFNCGLCVDRQSHCKLP